MIRKGVRQSTWARRINLESDRSREGDSASLLMMDLLSGFGTGHISLVLASHLRRLVLLNSRARTREKRHTLCKIQVQHPYTFGSKW